MACIAQFSCGLATLGPLYLIVRPRLCRNQPAFNHHSAPLVTAHPFCLAQFPFTITYFKVMYMSACLLFLVSFDTFVLCCVWPACHG